MDRPDLAVSLASHNGSVPPRDRLSERLTLEPTGDGTLVRLRGYGRDEATTRAVHLSPAAHRSLAEDLVALGAFETAWAPPSGARKIGGGQTTLRIRLGDREAEIGTVVAEQRAAKAALVARVREARPSG